MRTLKKKNWQSGVACLAVVILLLTAREATAQIKIGRVTVPIPKLSKAPRAEKPASAPTAAGGASATDGSEPPTGSPAISNQRTRQSDVRVEILLDEINKRKKEVETYEPSERTQLVTPSTPELFLPAISMRARETYYKRDQLNQSQQAVLNPALDSLAAAAAKKLPLFKPDAMLFALHNPPAELMMKQALKNASTIKVHRSGLKEATWLIEKNEFGLPLNRYKHGHLWARDNSDDHPYCHLYTIYVQQNYEGGGVYGAVFAHVFDSQIVGCP